MYSILLSDKNEKKAAKGVLRYVKDKIIKHENYKNCLRESKSLKHKQCRILQQEHELYTVVQNKVTLSPFNDKKWFMKIGEELVSHSYGHYNIKNLTEDDELLETLSFLEKEAND